MCTLCDHSPKTDRTYVNLDNLLYQGSRCEEFDITFILSGTPKKFTSKTK